MACERNIENCWEIYWRTVCRKGAMRSSAEVTANELWRAGEASGGQYPPKFYGVQDPGNSQCGDERRLLKFGVTSKLAKVVGKLSTFTS
ncbi:hypothetical protein Y032_0128g1461 [Ancylostoma ceylanicum]|uniref:Uncharacterized protein n=1 Tax=Ancylostoma ceylanicum TaxID=53326 RepID=A0A016T811_9BILA|nr:hypothetical protein Y032_0128g1461 [Ancylostoma ceylanicum]